MQQFSLLKRDRETGLPGAEHANLPPMTGSCDLRVNLGNSIHRSPKPLNGLRTPPPVTESLDEERDQETEPPGEKSPSSCSYPVCFNSFSSQCSAPSLAPAMSFSSPDALRRGSRASHSHSSCPLCRRNLA